MVHGGHGRALALAALLLAGLGPAWGQIVSVQAYLDGPRVLVVWQTGQEIDTAAFLVHRRLPVPGAVSVPVSLTPLPAQHHLPQGATYQLEDSGAQVGRTYEYRIEAIDARGASRYHGPYLVTVASQPKPPVPLRMRRRADRVPIAPRGTGWPGAPLAVATAVTGPTLLTPERLALAWGTTPAQVVDWIARGSLGLDCGGSPITAHALPEAAGLVFLATAPADPRAPHNITWVRRKPTTPGVVVRAGQAPPPGVPGGTFTCTAGFEEDYLRQVPVPYAPDPLTDHWFWDYLSAAVPGREDRTFELPVPGPAPGAGPATLRLWILGGLGGGDSQIEVAVGGTVVGGHTWSGTLTQAVALTVPGPLLQGGLTSVRVHALPVPGSLPSLLYVDRFQLEYERLLRAADDELCLTPPGPDPVTVSGFTTPDVLVFEVVDPARPALLEDVSRTHGPDGYTVTFQPRRAPASYRLLTTARLRTPAAVRADRPSRLRSPANRADHLLIVPDVLRGPALRLARHRRAQGLQSMVVDVQDVYDEFAGGLATPAALADLLACACDVWDVPPRYLLLVGGGTYDYLDHAGYGDNLIPPALVSTPYGLVAADTPLVPVTRRSAPPPLAIGRLPVRTATELDAVIDKIIAYETTVWEPWLARAIMLADDPDAEGDYDAESEALIGLLPPGVKPERVYLSQHDTVSTRRLLYGSLTRGAGLLNYVGHASVTRLTGEGVLRTIDVPVLDQSPRLPVLVATACLSCAFGIPGVDSITDGLLLDPDGGAVAVWGNADRVTLAGGRLLHHAFLDALPRHRRLGDVVRDALAAHAAAGAPEHTALTTVILGDPALILR